MTTSTITQDTGLDFLVDRQDWKKTQLVETPAPEPVADGQALLRVDRFALTANNISYALSGDMIGYWRFFPAEDGWGRIPVMGFADVVDSRHSDVPVGTRCFGFYPMSRYLVIQPGALNAGGFSDVTPHRADLPPVYAQFTPTDRDPLHAPEYEDAIMLMRGLFMTSFLVDDFLGDSDRFGAEAIVISSASSKTSIALAHQVSHGGSARAIGLTSAKNRAFVEGLGCYDQVIDYDEIASLPAETPVVFVDMAGNGGVTSRLHHHFGDNMKYSCSVGATHWSAERSDEKLPGPKPEFFFAPGQIVRRSKEWGAAELQRRIGEAWTAFREFSEGWLEVDRSQGGDALGRVYEATLAGEIPPNRGQVVSLWSGPR
jgi:hypothetical protein